MSEFESDGGRRGLMRDVMRRISPAGGRPDDEPQDNPGTPSDEESNSPHAERARSRDLASTAARSAKRAQRCVHAEFAPHLRDLQFSTPRTGDPAASQMPSRTRLRRRGKRKHVVAES